VLDTQGKGIKISFVYKKRQQPISERPRLEEIVLLILGAIMRLYAGLSVGQIESSVNERLDLLLMLELKKKSGKGESASMQQQE